MAGAQSPCGEIRAGVRGPWVVSRWCYTEGVKRR
jgi:hypothetical protein